MSNCCDDETLAGRTDIIARRLNDQNNRQNDSYCSVLAEVCSPIGRELTDQDTKYLLTFPYKFIPYFYGGDVSLSFFDRMAQLSVTHGSIIKSQVKWAIGLGMTVEIGQKKGWAKKGKIKANDIQTLLYQQFIDDSLVNADSLEKEIERAGKNYKQNGNIWIEVILIETAGVRQARLICHDSQYVRYASTERDNPNKTVYVSQSFDTFYLSQYPPIELPLYPNFQADSKEEGVYRSMIHYKNEEVGSWWYGKPDSIQGLYDMYKEYQLGDYTTKGYSLDWAAKLFIETYDVSDTENMNNADAKKEFDNSIKDVFTNGGGRRKTVMHKNQPQGREWATLIHEFQTQKDHEFDQVVANMSEKGLYKAHDWHVLLMDSVAGKLGGGSEFDSIVQLKNLTVIAPLQSAILSPFQTGLKEVETWVGFQNSQNLILGCESISEKILEDDAARLAGQTLSQQQSNA